MPAAKKTPAKKTPTGRTPSPKVAPVSAPAPTVAATTAFKAPDVYRNHNSNCVCVYYRSDTHTHFLGIDGPQLTTLKLSHDEFRREYDVALTEKSQLDFATTWTRDEAALKMVPISGSALRVLKGILAGQSVADGAADSLNQLEKHMATEQTEGGFRKPDGPVALVHKHLDKHLDKINQGTISRKGLIDHLVDVKGMSKGTVTTQAGAWARLNGVTFARPTAAAATKKEAKVATKKAAAKKAPAKAAKKKGGAAAEAAA